MMERAKRYPIQDDRCIAWFCLTLLYCYLRNLARAPPPSPLFPISYSSGIKGYEYVAFIVEREIQDVRVHHGLVEMSVESFYRGYQRDADMDPLRTIRDEEGERKG